MTMESIKSVQENPFFKHYGIRHNIPPPPRSSGTLETANNTTVDKFTSGFAQHDSQDAEVIEYHPVSGFVNKLRNRFSLQTIIPDPSLKRSTSLEKISAENLVKSAAVSLSVKGQWSNADKSSFASLSLSQRARSTENLSHISQKSQLSNHYSKGRTSSTEKVPEKKKFSSNAETQDQKCLENDHIIIIENNVFASPKSSISHGENVESSRSTSVNNYDSVFVDELPKPNTVLTVRSIFESASSSSDLYSRRQKQPKSQSAASTKLAPLQTETLASDQDSTSRNSSIQTPSPVTSPRQAAENYAKPVLLPSSVTSPRTFDHQRNLSDSRISVSSPKEEKSHTVTISVGSATNQFPRSQSPQKSAPTVSSLASNSDSAYELGKLTDVTENHYTNTASSSNNSTTKRLTDNYEHNHNLKPSSASVPALTASSYQKSRPVVSVAPFKDQPEEVRDDSLPVMVFSKSDLSKVGGLHNKNDITSQFHDVTPIESNNKLVSLSSKTNAFNSNTPESLPNQTIHKRTIELGNAQNITVEPKAAVGALNSAGHNRLDQVFTKAATTSDSQTQKTKRLAPQPPGLSQENESKAISFSTGKTQLSKEDSSKSLLSDKPSTVRTNELISASGILHQLGDAVVVKEQTPEEPVKGIPSIIAQRLKQPTNHPSQAADGARNSTQASQLDSESKKRSATAQAETINSEIENEITAVRRKMEANRAKAGGPAQIFDSSQLVKKKKKDNASSNGFIPRLDLSGISDDEVLNNEPVVKISPCKIVFIGENATTSRSLLDKTRKIKINIRFDDLKIETFEYLREEFALEQYLEEHPDERVEVLILQEFNSTNGDRNESSDDLDDGLMSSKDTLLKANTGLEHSGNLQFYRGRFHQEYEFGAVLQEEPKMISEPEPSLNPDQLMLRPAEEASNDTWSTSSTSDLLF